MAYFVNDHHMDSAQAKFEMFAGFSPNVRNIRTDCVERQRDSVTQHSSNTLITYHLATAMRTRILTVRSIDLREPDLITNYIVKNSDEFRTNF